MTTLQQTYAQEAILLQQIASVETACKEIIGRLAEELGRVRDTRISLLDQEIECEEQRRAA